MCPLVSVMVPCLNAERTLPWMLASLVSQTYRNWECLFVDGASTDRSCEVVERLGDPRIKIIRPARNEGRGAARQVALDHASGELLCMIDADDWIFPTKIEHQVEVLTRETGVDLVSTGFAVIDSKGDLTGVRARGPDGPLRVVGPVKALSMPPIAFPAAMMRTELARSVGFDPSLRYCEDLAFLIELLRGRCYALLPEASYAYHEYNSFNIEKMVFALRTTRRVYQTIRDRSPMECRLRSGWALAKEYAYRLGNALGICEQMVRWRSRPPAARDRAEFLAARRIVADQVALLFPEIGGAGELSTRADSISLTPEEAALR
jgi:glycosyltransferase involved in cell wall biosynthesis